MSRIPVIIDTDTAQDDCVTILLGLLDPRADLRAITMVAGNVGFDQQVANAHLTLNVAGRLGEVPVHVGCRAPILREWESAEDVHGDGSGGLSMDLTDASNADEHAVNALLRLTAEAPGEISIVAIGPLTNIATAVVMDRSFPSRVKSLSIMGGSNNGRGNITPSAEFNFYVDPEAAQVVLAAGFPELTIIPWAPLTLRDATFARPDYERLSVSGTPLARFFRRMCDATIDYDESVGVNGSTHPDSLTLATLLHPELVQASAPYRVDVETVSPLTRGMSSMAWGKFGLAPNATVVEQVDGAGFYALLASLLATPTTPSRPIAGLD
ncbi:MAG: nucleoside hydrolase [Propionicimonas sp.]|uniref:nucleoside hydrolase n=1 Tax=Propionicimonas sp. TaxID=1955623 RepID=UPI003D1346D7